MAKTRAELQAEIDELKKQLSEQEHMERMDEAVKPLWELFQAMQRAGFTEAQAWEMLTISISKPDNSTCAPSYARGGLVRK